jgi:hypothetical protein
MLFGGQILFFLLSVNIILLTGKLEIVYTSFSRKDVDFINEPLLDQKFDEQVFVFNLSTFSLLVF